jgi:hypothetical protein
MCGKEATDTAGEGNFTMAICKECKSKYFRSPRIKTSIKMKR